MILTNNLHNRSPERIYKQKDSAERLNPPCYKSEISRDLYNDPKADLQIAFIVVGK